MKIKIDNPILITIKEVPAGDLFAIPSTKELYLKTDCLKSHEHISEIISIRDGKFYTIDKNTKVMPVKEISVKF